MRILAVSAALALCSVGSTPAIASDQAKTATAKSDEVVCKRQKRSDTRFTEKICRTRAQWDEMAEQAKRDLAEQRNSGMHNMQRSN